MQLIFSIVGYRFVVPKWVTAFSPTPPSHSHGPLELRSSRGPCHTVVNNEHGGTDLEVYSMID